MQTEKAFKLSKELAKKAGQAILNIYNQEFSIHYKEDQSPLTIADLEANYIITDALRKAFPNIPILTEEEKDNKARLSSDYVFIIDPLDGTKEFIKKNGEFTLNIALVHNQKPIFGVIYLPCKKKLYSALKGKAAFLNEKPIHVSEVREMSKMTLAKSRSHSSEQIQTIEKHFKDTISAGSSLKGCLLAEGKADAYIRLGPTNEWDICAMSCIIQEAGGTITQLDGKEIPFNQQETLIKGFVASNKQNHSRIIELFNHN
jgi:3'(2'), 5'-bisphosphate nucleotidase